jgi:hypothetical protein
MTVSGKVFGLWNDLKAALAGHDRRSLLSCCQHTEAVTLRCYEACLKSPLLLRFPSRDMIETHAGSLRESQQLIASYKKEAAFKKK